MIAIKTWTGGVIVMLHLMTTAGMAQSTAEIRNPDLVSFSAAREYRPLASALVPDLSIPSNLVVSPVYRPLLERMIARSPTFRVQCFRIAGAPDLLVDLHLAVKPGLSGPGPRAITHLQRRQDGALSATVEIEFVTNADQIELIAHEFEHIIERLDDVDLGMKAV